LILTDCISSFSYFCFQEEQSKRCKGKTEHVTTNYIDAQSKALNYLISKKKAFSKVMKAIIIKTPRASLWLPLSGGNGTTSLRCV